MTYTASHEQTTFFTSTEAVLLGITTRGRIDQAGIEEATNAAFLGALVLHASAGTILFESILNL